MKQLITFSLLIFLFISSNATHINGGHITYRNLGNYNYEITLVVYRDCYNGVPPFDDPACIGVFDGSAALLQVLSVSHLPKDTVYTPGDCIPSSVCFEKAIYVDTVTIPPSSLPVTITYERCCRSIMIENFVNPDDCGMALFATINIADNNSALFISEIPGFTFVGDNFVFDGSAFDSDGDSLVYSLTDCYNGATGVNPQPNPPAAPPYTTIPWLFPYSLSNVLGGSTPLTIDPATGTMTAVPGSVGVFQVGEKVDEYRNGVWINSSRREFQMFINPGNYFDISGSVSADSNTQSLDIGKAWLIRKNLYDSTLTATDTNIVNTGSYTFPNTINGIYLLKASADSISPYYPNNIPTYYGDVLFWHQATELELCTNDELNIDINLIQGVNPGGPGFTGGHISQGANKVLNPGSPVGPLSVIIFNSANEPVAYAPTDISGDFSISNLPLGTYTFYIDKLNDMIDNTIAPSVTLTGSNPGSNNLSFTLYSDHLELNGYTNLGEQNGSEIFASVVPNPVKDEATLKYFLNKSSDISIEIYDLYGRKLKNSFQKNQGAGEHAHLLYFNNEEIKSGVYFVALKADGFSKVIRIIVI